MEQKVTCKHNLAAIFCLPYLFAGFLPGDRLLGTACRIAVLLISIILHELSHGFMAYHYGDMTAYRANRLTFNPLAHFEPIGLLMIMFAPVGWAKPVPVNPLNFDPKYNRKFANIVVSLAGVVMNFILALLGAFIFMSMLKYNQIIVSERFTRTLLLLSYHFYQINLGLLCFNILPIPPLDGYWIWSVFMPPRVQNFLNANSRNFMFALLILAIMPFNILGRLMTVILLPISHLIDLLIGLII